MPLTPVRPATAADLPALLAVETAAFAEHRYDRTSARQLRHALASASAIVLVAEDKHGSVTGYAHLLKRKTSRRLRLYSVAVLPNCHGQGFGRALLVAAQDLAQQSGFNGLHCEIRADNTLSLPYYRNNGFVLLRRLPAYYPDGCDGLKLLKTFLP
jgi:[ribosomal protein S18]-alanine N-acetyltransferase